MIARIIDGCVAEVLEARPTLGEAECAFIMEVGGEVRPGWLWTPEGCVAPPAPFAPSAPGPNAAIDAEILGIEGTVTQRRMRDAQLTDEGRAWLADVEGRIAALRAQRAPDAGDPA